MSITISFCFAEIDFAFAMYMAEAIGQALSFLPDITLLLYKLYYIFAQFQLPFL